ncbi:ATP-binding cassette domain-containing protein [Periweissella cryptocerci]|uniref:ATP-binding cassette domain-containing protein n=1 Tax=Periweissella cryptocerci TaxID=2506420 RepID=A0A4P6YS71_9LACO|nr:DUF3744 domain-containing protein [Periweissella cryptocerci]QBO35472.1 ATP-binding cassette domain-containing protein [Periweissella cryptocerci]
MTEPIIEFNDLTFQYRTQAEPTLHEINLKIMPGEKVLIAGASGSGKSTLSRLINGLIPESYAGTITGMAKVNGHDVNSGSIFARSFDVGTVLQDPDEQFVALTVGEDLAFALENDQIAHAEMLTRVNQWAQQLNVTALLKQAPQAISGGQKQRVAMGGVLIDESPILLFDEPLASLDPAAGKAAIEMIDDIARAHALTTIIIEHRLEDVLHRPIDRLIVLDNGRIVADDTPANVLRAGKLPSLGLREPLYLAALAHAGVDFNSLTNIDNVQTVNGSDIQDKLSGWLAQQPTTASQSAQQSLLEIEHLAFAYPRGKQIFTDLNITVNTGELISIVGKNGSGKSTLSNLITGFLKPTAGQIKLNGQDLTELSIKERADQIGYVLQNPNQMISKNTVYEEVALGLELRGIELAQVTAQVAEILRLTDLYTMRNWPISALSFGQKKRVTIASILVLKPKVLILDEPTAGQDLAHYTAMMNFLANLRVTNGITIIIITHDMHLMLEYADRTIVISDGQLLLDATPSEVLNNAPVVKAASLALTSLYYLAQRFELGNPEVLTTKVIAAEQQAKKGVANV